MNTAAIAPGALALLLLLNSCGSDAGSGIADEILSDVVAEVSVDAAVIDLPEAEEAVAEVAAEVIPSLPLAAVYLTSPAEDSGTTVVSLPGLDPEGTGLTGAFANVFNCLNEPGGQHVPFNFGGMDVFVDLCHEVQTVVPGPDGNYLHIEPADEGTDPDDAFAELMGYFHVNGMHDYFADTHGYEHVDRSLYTLMNFQVNLMGAGWMAIDNAAYLPEGSLEEMGISLSYEEDLIVMGQGTDIDFGYDGHEYTHFAIGPDRFLGYRFDEYGVDSAPISLHEALADFFPSSISGDPVLGKYSLGSHARNLTHFRMCPDDYMGESHHDGQIASSALWEIRSLIGSRITDIIAFSAMFQSGPQTGFQQFGELALDATKEHFPAQAGIVETVLQDHGMLACRRVVPLAYGGTSGKYMMWPGTLSVGLPQFNKFVPAPLQFEIRMTGNAPLIIEADVGYAGMSGLFPQEGDPKVRLAVRRGQEVVWEYDPKTKMVKDVLVKWEKLSGDRYRWEVPVKATEGETFFVQFVNYSYVDIGVNSVSHVIEGQE